MNTSWLPKCVTSDVVYKYFLFVIMIVKLCLLSLTVHWSLRTFLVSEGYNYQQWHIKVWILTK